ncbi:Phenylpyruvate tautomerase PptA, 4-oxalocrotonate tautomerase family [Halanaeroarchaeum sp. HSR-CO]|uniref:4-oxalocrotonate tautomerase family protein n=1 Tax=Halanaeroarchaeum sp. HSR-CO TaxID=2866382 RepID=UPI00217CFE53|nr:4-oxalocrotonate tautomerase family protein [Halanaeroarchaeum sp. HSR-CO]UWG46784.1 Phenylpyruvate tautomerase PptA, 4-oxalocrotonate tautomerase family [Halanaeroarchaeum sp. HSR-CO]
MPYLQFDADFPIAADDAAAFERRVAEVYADRMDADTSYTAVAVRDDVSLFLGRAEGERRVVLKADIRRGRTENRKRELALEIIDLVHETFDVPTENQKVVVTEHDGHQMMGADRVGDDWSESAAE